VIRTRPPEALERVDLGEDRGASRGRTWSRHDPFAVVGDADVEAVVVDDLVPEHRKYAPGASANALSAVLVGTVSASSRISGPSSSSSRVIVNGGQLTTFQCVIR
jgi:hypothetical protein